MNGSSSSSSQIGQQSSTVDVAAANGSGDNVKLYRPYYSPVEIEQMSAKQRGKLSVNREERIRQQACGFIDAVGVRCGFPRKTIATAQTLYIRFHLFFPYRDFRYMEVCLSTLYVASKLHDTLKKPREIILASYPLRFPHLIKKNSGGGGTLDAASVDAHALEAERSRVLGIERLVLEGVCFMFGVEGMEGVVRISRALGLTKDMTQAAWRMHIDCYRTLAPLTYPTHTTALGCIYVAALLSLEDPRGIAPDDVEAQAWWGVTQLLGANGSWEERWSTTADQVDRIAHCMIDLHMIILSTPPSDPQHTLTPSPSSPREPPGNQPSKSGSSAGNTIGNTAFRLSPHWTLGTLTDLKVHLREQRPSPSTMEEEAISGSYGLEDLQASQLGLTSASQGIEEIGQGLGKNDGTVRFVWGEDVAPVA